MIVSEQKIEEIISPFSLTAYGQQWKSLPEKNYEFATFGAGCFWGVEYTFREQQGIIGTSVGYMGGHLPNPSYKDVCSNRTGHAEVVHLLYDPTIITFSKLLTIFWQNHNPTTLNRQGPDVGTQYRSAVFYHSETQRTVAEAMKLQITKEKKFSNPVVTEITPALPFYRAEDYHQLYLEKNGRGHCQVFL